MLDDVQGAWASSHANRSPVASPIVPCVSRSAHTAARRQNGKHSLTLPITHIVGAVCLA